MANVKYPLGQGALAQIRLGDESSTTLRPFFRSLSLFYQISLSRYGKATLLTYQVQTADTQPVRLYYLIAPPSIFSINGDGSIVNPDRVQSIPRPVTARMIQANPVLQGYKSMTWTYSTLLPDEYTFLASFYNPQNPVVLLTYPDPDTGTWVQQAAVMHPPQYGQQVTVSVQNTVFTFTRLGQQ